MIGATLFSGIGAPEVAMPHWQWPWHAEIEKFPCAVMRERHPQSVNLGDVTAHDFCARAAAIGKPDVLVFGSPCQSYSVAGKRLGLDDPRGNLALVALGIVARLEPRWFVFENVPGLLSSSEGRDFGLFLRTVDELGYSASWTVLDAQYFGVAQRRARVFAVGHLGYWRGPAAVLLEPESLCGDSPPRREAGEGIAPTIASRPTGGGGLGTDFDCDGELIAGFNNTGQGWWNDADVAGGLRDMSAGSGSKEATLVAHALNAHGGSGRIDYESETFITHALRADGFDANEDGTGRGTPLVTHALDSFSAGRMTEDGTGRGCPIVPVAFSCKDHGADASDLAPILRAMGHSGSHPNACGQLAVAFALGSHAGAADGDQTNRSHANGGPVGSGISENLSYSLRGGHTQAIAMSAVRRLTPRECERLQGFPDDYTLISYRGKPAADGPRYKALGNSMAVPFVRWILNRIELFEQQNDDPSDSQHPQSVTT